MAQMLYCQRETSQEIIPAPRQAERDAGRSRSASDRSVQPMIRLGGFQEKLINSHAWPAGSGLDSEESALIDPFRR